MSVIQSIVVAVLSVASVSIAVIVSGATPFTICGCGLGRSIPVPKTWSVGFLGICARSSWRIEGRNGCILEETSSTKASDSADMPMPKIFPSNAGASTFFGSPASDALPKGSINTERMRIQNPTSTKRVGNRCSGNRNFMINIKSLNSLHSKQGLAMKTNASGADLSK